MNTITCNVKKPCVIYVFPILVNTSYRMPESNFHDIGWRNFLLLRAIPRRSRIADPVPTRKRRVRMLHAGRDSSRAGLSGESGLLEQSVARLR